MQLNNEILHDFINCQYKAYRKSKWQKGTISEYEIIYNQLKHTQKINFEKKLLGNNKQIRSNLAFDIPITKSSFFLNFTFINDNLSLTLDGIEFVSKKNFLPLFVTPFEKVTKVDKLFIALQAALIQNEFNIHADCCNVIYGQNLKQIKFKLSSFAQTTKKIIVDLYKTLSNSVPPSFQKNIHCSVCEFQNNCFEKLVERDDLSLMPSLKAKDILQKNNKGIFSVRQLSYTFRPKKNLHQKRKFLPELKALAIRENKTFVNEIPNIKDSTTEVFLDIEGIPDRNFNY